jgi:hypothetical protein
MGRPPDARKERVIHARVPESLDDELRRRATSLGVSVSNLVRNVLQNTFGLVEDIVADSAEVARARRRAKARARARAASLGRPRVLGWQSARLAVNAVCEVCNEVLPRGRQATIAVLEGEGPARFRCERCVEAAAEREEDSDDTV